MTEAEYDAVAFPELATLVQALDALDVADVQAELAGHILTVEFEDGRVETLFQDLSYGQLAKVSDIEPVDPR